MNNLFDFMNRPRDEVWGASVPPITAEIIRYLPDGMDLERALDVIQNYGFNNDTVLPVPYDNNKTAVKITITIKNTVQELGVL